MLSHVVVIFVNCLLRVEAWVLHKWTDLETYCHTRLRRATFPRCLFAVSLLTVSALAACTGMFLSQTTTLEDSHDVCRERFSATLYKVYIYVVLSVFLRPVYFVFSVFLIPVYFVLFVFLIPVHFVLSLFLTGIFRSFWYISFFLSYTGIFLSFFLFLYQA
jgi:hypothetical protein